MLQILRIFDSIKPQIESTFPFLYIILKMAIFGALPNSTPEGDRHVHPLTFLCRIQCWTVSIWSVFSYNAYFWQRQAPKWIYFPVFVNYNISKMSIFQASTLLRRKIDECAHWLFVQNSMLNNFYLKCFLILCDNFELCKFFLTRKCTYTKAKRYILYFALRKMNWRLKIS